MQEALIEAFVRTTDGNNRNRLFDEHEGIDDAVHTGLTIPTGRHHDRETILRQVVFIAIESG